MIAIVVTLGLIVLGFGFGLLAERSHLESIRRREYLTRDLHCFSERFPPLDQPVRKVKLVTGNIVISIDYFKRIRAVLHSLFGGRDRAYRAYEALLERARREAILRMKDDAIKKHAQSIFNVKIETSPITSLPGQLSSVEVMVYGTALIE